MIFEPELIPCVTRHKRSDFQIHLHSPSKQHPFLRAKKQTVVDCFTFGLRLNQRRINPVKHYLWFTSFVQEMKIEEDLVFVAPDCDWVGEVSTRQIAREWIKKCVGAKVLVVPGTFLFDKVDNIIGYAIKQHQNVSHLDWVHSFSRYINSYPKRTKRWTFDMLI